VLLSVSGPQGVSLEYTDGKMQEIEALVEPLRASGEVKSVFAIAGMGGQSSRGFIVVTLADWADRTRSQQEIAADINASLQGVIGVRTNAIQPNSLGIRGAGQGLSMALVGDDYSRLAEVARTLVERLEDDPRFGQVRLGYDTTQPQLFVEIDRTRAEDLGVEIDGLGEAFQAVLDGRTVGTLFVDDDSFDIRLVSTTDPVNDPGDLERIFVPSRTGQMIPVSSFATLTERAVAPELGREAQRRSVPISASLTPEFALGAALPEMQRLADDLLAEDMRLIPLAEAATLGESSSGLLITFGIALAVVFLVAVPAVLDYVQFSARRSTMLLHVRLDLVYSCFTIFMIAVVLGAATRLRRLAGSAWREAL
jgi:HAE1 family hydrophobic/amphiphilic exporter-1